MTGPAQPPSPRRAGPDPLTGFAARLQNLGADPTARELAEALWLARFVDARRGGRTAPRAEPPRETAPEPPDASGQSADGAETVGLRPLPPGHGDGREPAGRTGPDQGEDTGPRGPYETGHLGAGPGAGPVRVPVATAFSGLSALQRALRPLQQYRPPQRSAPLRLDEQATAERAASTGLLLPALCANGRRQARVRLLMDVSTSTVVWEQALEELRQVCAGAGAFREVSVHYVYESGEGRLLVGPAPDGGRPRRAPEQLSDPTGQQLTLVFSDCAGPLWRSGRMQRLLHTWAATSPLALVQPLPQRMWRRTHLPALPGMLRRREGLSGRLEFRPLGSADGGGPGGPERRGNPARAGAPVPVLAPTHSALGTWARLLSGSTGLSLPAAAGRVYADHPPAERGRAAAGTAPLELVRSFRATASRPALELAVSLSAAPLFLPVMQLVQRATLPHSGPSVMAEVLLSGLLQRGEQKGWYEFAPGVREALLTALPMGDALAVLRQCSAYVERHFGRNARNFPALAVSRLTGTAAERSDGEGPDALRPFAEVSEQVINRYTRTVPPRTGVVPSALRPGTAPGSADGREEDPDEARAALHRAPRPSATSRPRAARRPDAESVLVVYPGRHRSWAAWISHRLEVHGHRVMLQRWDPAREQPLEEALGDLLPAGGRVLLVLSGWFFELGPPEGEWTEVLRGFVSANAERFAAVSLTDRPLPAAAAVLEPVGLWGVNEEEAERRLLARLDLTPASPRRELLPFSSGPRYPNDPPAVWGEVPRRNRHFAGRDDLLEELRQRLDDAEQGASACTLVGMSGIGKTQIAVEYAHRYFSDYDFVWWVNADQRGTLRERFGEFAVALGLTESPEGGERIRAVRDGLRRGEPNGRWLLVFDGWEETEEAERMLPEGGTGHVLITSRNRSWNRFADLFDVPGFRRDESVGYLTRKAPQVTADEADQLAAEFDDVPLQLVQAAAWLGESQMPVAGYLRMVRRGSEAGGSEAPGPDPVLGGFPISSLSAWAILINRLRVTEPRCVELLALCCAFAPGWIPLGLVRELSAVDLPEGLRQLAADDGAWDRTVATLVNYSVLTVGSMADTSDAPGGRNHTVHMHRVVHGIVGELTAGEDQEKYRKSVRRALVIADPDAPSDNRHWLRYTQLLPHLAPSGALKSTEPKVQALVLNCLRACMESGDYRGGAELAAVVRGHWFDALPEDAEPMLALATVQGNLLRAVGDFREAYQLDVARLEMLRASSAPDEEALMTATSCLAADQRFLGRYAEALQAQREVVSTAERLHGPDGWTALLAQHNLGVGLRLVGRYEDAYEVDRYTFRRREILLRDRHPDILASSNACARDLRLMGRYREALAQQERCVRDHVQVLGPQHPKTLWARHNLLLCERDAGTSGRDGGALLARLLEQQEHTFGRSHYSTFALLTDYGNHLRRSGDLPRARNLLTEADEGYRRLLGQAHPIPTAMQSNIGLLLQAEGDPDGALIMFEQALTGTHVLLGSDHPVTLGCALNAAVGRSLTGRLDDALELSRGTLRRAAHALGEDHPLTLSSGLAFAVDLAAAGEHTEADKQEEDALQRFTRTLGAQHPYTRFARQRTRPYWDFEPYLG